MAEEPKVKIKLISDVVLGPDEDGKVGETVEVSPADARALIGAGQAEECNGESENKPANGRRKKPE